MHNFDNLLFIKQSVSIFKTTAFLIYLQGLNIQFQEERKSHIKEKCQGNLKPKGGGLYFSGIYKLCFALLFCFSVTVLCIPFGMCLCNILSTLPCVSLVSTKQEEIMIVFHMHKISNLLDKLLI